MHTLWPLVTTKDCLVLHCQRVREALEGCTVCVWGCMASGGGGGWGVAGGPVYLFIFIDLYTIARNIRGLFP